MNRILRYGLLVATVWGIIGNASAFALPVYIETPTQILVQKYPVHCMILPDKPFADMSACTPMKNYSGNIFDGFPDSMKCAEGEVILQKKVSYFGADTNDKKIPLKLVAVGHTVEDPLLECAHFATPDVDVNKYPCPMIVTGGLTNPATEGVFCAAICEKGSFIEYSITCGTIGRTFNLEPVDLQRNEPKQYSPSWFGR